MVVLITGVAGFIGSNLAAALLENGHTVIGIDNFSYGEKRNITSLLNSPLFTLIEGDAKQEGIYPNLRADVVVHLASQKIPRYTSAFITLEENNLLLKAALAYCLKHNARILFASTSDVYGKNPNLPYHEESDFVLGNSTIKRWAYALSKIYGEQYILALAQDKKLQYTIVRFFGSYGPNQNLTWWGGPQSLFIGHALKNTEIEIHGDGLQTRTFTFIKDTVQALVKCIESNQAHNEIFNIASEPTEEITIKDLAYLIWGLVNGENSVAKINFIPYSSFGNYEDVKRRVPDIRKIKQKLDYKPKYSLKEGLIETIDWQRSIGE